MSVTEPRVFTIPPGAPFLATLADALVSGRLVEGFGGDPLAMSAATIYLPTRRAARALAALLAELIETHLQGRRRPQIVISDERGELLETGGGVKKALPLLPDAPFVLLNSDSLWIDAGPSNLAALRAAWDGERMDILLLVASVAESLGYEGRGDFFMDTGGRLARRRTQASAPYVYAGVAILKPQLFDDTPDGAFSLNLLFDRAIAADRLYGRALDGQWLHVGTPDAIAAAEERLASMR